MSLFEIKEPGKPPMVVGGWAIGERLAEELRDHAMQTGHPDTTIEALSTVAVASQLEAVERATQFAS